MFINTFLCLESEREEEEEEEEEEGKVLNSVLDYKEEMMVIINLLILVLLIKNSCSVTSIRTFSTIELKENIGIGSEIVELNEENGKSTHGNYVLLNLSGFETNYFELENKKVRTINSIDREEFLRRKFCFDVSKCLIELHLLVNNGEEYWIIPIHIVE